MVFLEVVRIALARRFGAETRSLAAGVECKASWACPASAMSRRHCLRREDFCSREALEWKRGSGRARSVQSRAVRPSTVIPEDDREFVASFGGGGEAPRAAVEEAPVYVEAKSGRRWNNSKARAADFGMSSTV